MASKAKVAIVGSGNIGTDLMIKIMRTSDALEMGVMVGIDPDSDGLARAKKFGFAATHEGLEGLTKMPEWKDIAVVFDATSAGAHKHNAALCEKDNKIIIDLTPAAIGPYVVPVVNMDQHLDANNINMVTCGGQATIPMTPNRTPRWRFTPGGLIRPNGDILFGIRSAWALSKQSLSGDPTS